MTEENIKALLKEAQENLDGGFIWHYINESTNLTELLEASKDTDDKIISVSMAAFFAGMKFTLENIDIKDE